MSDKERSGLSLEDMKITIFDPVLAHIISVRVIYSYQVLEYFRHRPVMERLAPVIGRIVNPAVLDLIRDKTLVPAPNAADLRKKVYIPEDHLRSCVRKLVEFEHGRNDKAFVRSLTESCINLVVTLVHSKEFGVELADIVSTLRIRRRSK